MRRTDSLTAAYPIRSVEGETTQAFPQFPVINQSNNAYPAASDGTAPLVLGQTVMDKYGFLYIFVRAGAALAAGQVCTFLANVAEKAILAADTVADNIHVVKTTHASLTAGEEIGNFLHFGNSTGSVGDLKLIKGNTTSTATPSTYFTISKKQIFQGRSGYDADAPAAAYAVATSEVSLIRNWHVDVCGDNGIPVGIAMGTVTSGNDTIIQIEGLAQVLGVAGTSFTDLAPVYAAAAGEVDVTDPLTGPGVTARVGYSRSAYGGANSVKVPIWLANVSSKW